MADAPREPAVLPTISRPGKPLSIRLATIARSLIVLTTLAVLAACYFGRDILAPVLFARGLLDLNAGRASWLAPVLPHGKRASA